mmetsp:Transcript_13571/g.32146  ORF Transcript_13571/g.32146 Transcript_13571/m.32146 type:complete len:242 (-) Transcript_13571:422-1147(-)
MPDDERRTPEAGSREVISREEEAPALRPRDRRSLGLAAWPDLRGEGTADAQPSDRRRGAYASSGGSAAWVSGSVAVGKPELRRVELKLAGVDGRCRTSPLREAATAPNRTEPLKPPCICLERLAAAATRAMDSLTDASSAFAADTSARYLSHSSSSPYSSPSTGSCSASKLSASSPSSSPSSSMSSNSSSSHDGGPSVSGAVLPSCSWMYRICRAKTSSLLAATICRKSPRPRACAVSRIA